jgi:hypothetical protein
MTLTFVAIYLILSVLASHEIIHEWQIVPDPTILTAIILVVVWPVFFGAWFYGFIKGMLDNK